MLKFTWMFGVFALTISLILSIGDVVSSSTNPTTEADQKEVQNGILYFGTKVVKILQKRQTSGQQNILISAINIYSALDLLLIGASGETLKQLSYVMGLKNSSNLDDDSKALAQMQKQLSYKEGTSRDNQTGEIFTNGIFIQNDFGIEPSYQKFITNNFQNVVVKNYDFRKNAAQATNDINKWVSNNTEGLIPTLFQSPLSSDTLITLVATLYFKGLWLYKFEESRSQK